MDILAEEFEFDVITSDKALRFFEGHQKVRHLFSQVDANMKSRFPYGSFMFYIRYAVTFVPRLIDNYFTQKKLIDENRYDLVIFDSDYSFILHRLFSDRILVGLNNSAEVLNFFKRHPSRLKPELWLSYFVESLDYLLSKIFLHFVLCPSISSRELKQSVKSSKFLVGPLLIRARLIIKETDGTGPLIIVASSSGEKSELQIIAKSFPDAEKLIHKFKADNTELLKSASAIFCNAGQSSIAECLYLKKPAILFPIPKHAEQLANSILAEQESLCMYRGQAASELLHLCKTARKTKPPGNWDYVSTKEIYERYVNHALAFAGRR
jgi:hypothetical protein